MYLLLQQTPTSMMPNMMVEIDKPTIISLESFNKSISENLEDLQVSSLEFFIEVKGTRYTFVSLTDRPKFSTNHPTALL